MERVEVFVPSVSGANVRKEGNLAFYAVTGIFIFYTVLPLISVLLFSIAGKWTNTILPERWSLSAYVKIFSNAEFISSLTHSCVVSLCVVAVDLSVVILGLLGVSLGAGKKALALMEALAIIPIALPGVVLALASVTFFGEVLPMLLGSPLLLICAESAFSLPLVFWTLRNAFRNTDIKQLYHASCVLGAPLHKFIFMALLPALNKGIMAGGALAFTTAFNNFALAQLIVGARWKTLPVLQNGYIVVDGHQTSAMAIISIALTFTLIMIAGTISGRRMGETRQ
jgi:putative spermidine/putrescine transport system permease protein